ncbi:DUF3365 domain-containing protein [Nitrogeniibacter mangrovi]|uniref:DUF3365 domain-containing protein n=1 Tax=Nitrogeniibacter mangrovi TaxID=2016596 RepID=A0A6C1B6H1_9RHOO|nr:DUF3365 domain-containing protein [Nitrogeniibacter mangrovi]QID19332.1 DUF3365 domain-containing protein [Nitrogeniibacter mangrovi]
MRTAALCAGLIVAGGALAQNGDPLMSQTRQQVVPVLPKVVAMMRSTVKAEGAAGAIPVCREKAPALMKERAAALGWQIRRVSLKTRNPERGTPDVWEARQLAEFNLRAAAGEQPGAIEAGEIVTRPDGRQAYRYMKALPVAQVCLNCHGEAASLPADLKAALARNYPQDRATGYQLGEIRGALTVIRPLP